MRRFEWVAAYTWILILVAGMAMASVVLFQRSYEPALAQNGRPTGFVNGQVVGGSGNEQIVEYRFDSRVHCYVNKGRDGISCVYVPQQVVISQESQ